MMMFRREYPKILKKEPPFYWVEFIEYFGAVGQVVTLRLADREWVGDATSNKRFVQTLKRMGDMGQPNGPHVYDRWFGAFGFEVTLETRESLSDSIYHNIPDATKPIYALLESRPHGVTFSEFAGTLNPTTGHRLTVSRDPNSIAAMLRRHNKSLTPWGVRITYSIKGNRIRLERIFPE